MYRDHTVAVVVPAYNEEGYVGNVIETIPSYVDRVYAVDDGSTDGTWEEIRRHAQARNADADVVVPIRHDENSGVGAAIKTGYDRARAERIDITAVLGGDDQMDPTVLTRYLDPIVDGTADYTKGTRFARPDDWAAMPRFRAVGNVVLSYLTKVASGYWGLMDSQNGYSAISLTALDAIDLEGLYEYYGYCNDLLIRLNTAGMAVADVAHSADFTYSDDWKSHIEYTEYIPRVSVMLLRGFIRRLGRKYLLYRYSPIAPLYAIGGIVSGAASLGFLSALAGKSEDGPGTWLVGLVAGLVVLLTASVLDRAENRPLEHQVDDRESPTRAAKGQEYHENGDGAAEERATEA
jgi:glycosyltransferase involved in cell wall biosynthesis